MIEKKTIACANQAVTVRVFLLNSAISFSLKNATMIIIRILHVSVRLLSKLLLTHQRLIKPESTKNRSRLNK